jgi:hypothetical protein
MGLLGYFWVLDVILQEETKFEQKQYVDVLTQNF